MLVYLYCIPQFDLGIYALGAVFGWKMEIEINTDKTAGYRQTSVPYQ